MNVLAAIQQIEPLFNIIGEDIKLIYDKAKQTNNKELIDIMSKNFQAFKNTEAYFKSRKEYNMLDETRMRKVNNGLQKIYNTILSKDIYQYLFLETSRINVNKDKEIMTLKKLLANRDGVIEQLKTNSLDKKELEERDLKIKSLEQERNNLIDLQKEQEKEWKFYGPITERRQNLLKVTLGALDIVEAEQDGAQVSEDRSSAIYDKKALKNHRKGESKPIMRKDEKVVVPLKKE